MEEEDDEDEDDNNDDDDDDDDDKSEEEDSSLRRISIEDMSVPAQMVDGVASTLEGANTVHTVIILSP
jgi:hypothetical protein